MHLLARSSDDPQSQQSGAREPIIAIRKQRHKTQTSPVSLSIDHSAIPRGSTPIDKVIWGWTCQPYWPPQINCGSSNGLSRTISPTSSTLLRSFLALSLPLQLVQMIPQILGAPQSGRALSASGWLFFWDSSSRHLVLSSFPGLVVCQLARKIISAISSFSGVISTIAGKGSVVNMDVYKVNETAEWIKYQR